MRDCTEKTLLYRIVTSHMLSATKIFHNQIDGAIVHFCNFFAVVLMIEMIDRGHGEVNFHAVAADYSVRERR